MDATEITDLLNQWQEGDHTALANAIAPMLERLEQRARSMLNDRVSMEPQELVNEVFVRLLPQSNLQFEDRGHFFRIAGRLMHNIIVDHIRRQSAQKRGYETTLEETMLSPLEMPATLLEVETLLTKLKDIDNTAYHVVEFRMFLGLTLEEIAAVVDRSRASVHRDWVFAKTYLQRQWSS